MNWKTGVGLAMVLALGFFVFAQGQAGISGKDAREKVKNGAMLVDVRTEGEFQSGHIDNAINVPVQVLEQNLSKLPKDKEIIVYCRSGKRSASAKRTLERLGYM
jgi:rhodanese-related sulfurtransferase